MPNSKKILITGGTGFVGYHLSKLLLEKGHAITIVDNFFRSKKDTDLEELLKNPSIKLIEADLTDPKSWDLVGTGYDYVYHLAGVNGTKLFYEIPHEVLRIGITTTLNALDWFRLKNSNPSAKILYTSSNEAYAGALEAFGQLPIPTPENVPLVIADPYNPRWSYAGQKLIGELLFIHYSNVHKFRMSIVRPHNFYGPREGNMHVIPEFIERALKKVDPFPVFGAEETRSFCHIADAVKAMVEIMESEKTDGRTYHIGSEEETTILDLAKKLFRILDWEPKSIEIKNSPKGSVRRRLADVSKIKKDIGWQPTIDLETGLIEMIDWHKRQAELR